MFLQIYYYYYVKTERKNTVETCDACHHKKCNVICRHIWKIYRYFAWGKGCKCGKRSME